MFWCTSCSSGPCINASSNPTSLSTSDITKRINHSVRIPASLYTMNKQTLSVNASFSFDLPTFSGPSDQFIRSVNPLTNSVGVDKKHNSYDRYLARKKGTVVCCCVCTQLLSNQDTGLPTIFVGDTISQATTGATGTIIKIELLPIAPFDVERITVRLNDCPPLFDDTALIIDRLGYTWSNFTILESNTCR